MAKPIISIVGVVTNVGRFATTICLDESGHEVVLATPISGLKPNDRVAVAVVKIEE